MQPRQPVIAIPANLRLIGRRWFSCVGEKYIAAVAAPDGVVEACRVGSAPGSALALQRHPDWRATEHPISRALYAAFGDAGRGRAARQ